MRSAFRESPLMQKIAWTLVRQRVVQELASPFYAGVGSIVVLHRVVPRVQDLTPISSVGGEIDVCFLRQILATCRDKRIPIVSLDEVVDRLQSASRIGTRPRQPFVAFTFDDGWRDNLTLALPLFREFEAPFAVYVATAFPERVPLAWKYNLVDLLLGARHLEFSWEGRDYRFELSAPNLRADAYGQIINLLVNAGADSRATILAALFGKSDDPLRRKMDELCLSWSELQQLASDRLVTVGAHTLNHFNLRRLSEEDARNEIAGSRSLLRERLGVPIEHFAYPYGGPAHADVREFDVVRQLGFRSAVTTRIGCIFPAHDAMTERLPRVPLSGKLNRVAYFRASVSGALPAMANGLRRIA